MAVTWLCLLKMNYNTGIRREDRSARTVPNAGVLQGPVSPGVRLPSALSPGVGFIITHVVSPSSPFLSPTQCVFIK